jgi:hypothetical protein
MKQRTCVLMIVTALILVLAMPVQAGTRIEVGPKAGLGFVTMTGDQASELSLTQGSDPSFLVRGHGGAFLSLVLNDRLAIQTEIAFVQKGAEWEKTISSNDTTSTATQNVGLDYIEIPILLKLTLPTSGRFQPYLSVGPTIAFNVGSETKVDIETFKGGSKIGHLDIYADNIENAKGTLFEAIVAGGVEMKMGTNRLSLEGRYTRSFGDTFEDVADLSAVPEGKAVIANIPSGKALEVQHSDFSILIGYSFGFDL